ncbi:MAG: formimidoylglutamase [Balneolaceae bacterium]
MEIDNIKEGNEVVLLGFSSDEGVKRNKGRTGASKGPDYFRESIGSLCWHSGEQGFSDIGNIKPFQEDLEEAQEELGKTVHHLLKKRKNVFVIGGGHETAFGHYLGVASFLKETQPDAKLGILNIDAHFDLREYHGIAHSGSPFLQAYEHAQENNLELKYFVYGVNRDNNTKALFNKAEELGAENCTNRNIQDWEMSSLENIRNFIQSRTHIYLTICLDVFKSSIAPGVSAPAWNGIDLEHALRVVELVKKSGKLLSIDVCELNPEFDENQKTAKLAGTLFSEWLG